jgi:nitrate/nitrite transporter NarK
MALIVGIPLFSFLKRKGLLNWWQVGFAGALAGLLAPLIFSIIFGGLSSTDLAFIPLFSVVGLVCGLIFWALAISKNPALTHHSSGTAQKRAAP